MDQPPVPPADPPPLCDVTGDPDALSGRSIALFGLAFEGGLAVLALAIGWLLGRSPWVGVSWAAAAWPAAGRAVVMGLIAVLPMLAGLFLIDRYPVGPLRELKEFVDRHVVPLFQNTSVVQLALIALVAGIGEELLFRGLVQHALSEWIGPPRGVWIGLAVASVIFGVCHWLTRTYAVLAGLIGIYLGLLLVLSGSVLAPMVAHGVYDFVALIYLCRAAPAEHAPQ
jgi:membrane protease YdiL (CAAX protease family)